MATFNTWESPVEDRTQSLVQLRSPIVNLKIVKRTRRAAPDYDASLIMRLPPEIHRMLFAYLDATDSICLLLTCKYFTRVGSTINTERHSIQVGPEMLRVGGGFSDRVPARLRLCAKCGIMRPKDPGYWEPHRSGWNWRQLIRMKDHRRFANNIHAWSAGRKPNCPRCFGTFVAQGNLHIGQLPIYGNLLKQPSQFLSH